MRRVLWGCVSMVLVCAASAAAAQGAGSEERAKAAFEEIVKRCGDVYGRKRPERIAELPGGGFMRVGGADSKLSYDITRTQSLMSPLLGVLTSEVTGYGSKTMRTKEEAESAPLEPAIMTKDTLTFAYQDGVWVYKSIRMEGFSIKDGVIGRPDVVLTTDPKRGSGPTPSSAYVCAFGDK